MNRIRRGFWQLTSFSKVTLLQNPCLFYNLWGITSHFFLIRVMKRPNPLNKFSSCSEKYFYFSFQRQPVFKNLLENFLENKDLYSSAETSQGYLFFHLTSSKSYGIMPVFVDIFLCSYLYIFKKHNQRFQILFLCCWGSP